MAKQTNGKAGFRKQLQRWTLKIVLWFFILSVGWVVLARFVPVLVTPLMLIRAVEEVCAGNRPHIRKTWVPIERISPQMVRAVVAAEDNLFMQHNGFSFKDIEKAIAHNKKGKRIRGGSTISQQTAKNVFLWPHRSWFRKGLETYFTVLVELLWPKERIMEVYLNVIETGTGIYGVEAAAVHYFGRHASELTPSQAALVAVCLPNPRKFSPAKPSAYIKRRQTKIMRVMKQIGPVRLK